MADTRAAQPHPAAQTGLVEWHRIVAELDWDHLPDLLVDDVVFRSPATIESFHGKQAMTAILRGVFSVLQDFHYQRHFASGTGHVLEFTARVGDAPVVGVDLIEFDQHGKITDFMVIMRPAPTVTVLAEEVGKRLAAR